MIDKFMDLSGAIYVAGHSGLVGSAIVRALKQYGYRNLLLCSHAELELLDRKAVAKFFEQVRPEFVFVAAAKVGGIAANNNCPADFIFQNLAIATNVIDAAYRAGTRRLLYLGSSCVYPRACPQPIKEEYLLTGALEPTNRAYAVAKIAGIEMCWSYNRQYGTKFLAAMPTNLYGPGDNYDLTTSHVIPALIRKMHEAKLRGDRTVSLWGTGTPRREFLYSDDLGDACVFLMNLEPQRFAQLTEKNAAPPLINIGSGKDLTIKALAEIIASVVGFRGNLLFDTNQVDGTPRKVLDTSRMSALGWRYKTRLEEGLPLAYADLIRSRSQPLPAAFPRVIARI